MSRSTLENLLDQGRLLYYSLEQETLHFLNCFSWADAKEIMVLEKRRQELVAAVQNIDKELQLVLYKETNIGEMHGTLAEFRKMQETVIHRVIEADRMLIILAKESMYKLKEELSTIGEGKHALHGYTDSNNSASLFQQTA